MQARSAARGVEQRRSADHNCLNSDHFPAEDPGMELRNCPYDQTPITIAQRSGGSLLLSCGHCGAQWERHGAWLRKLEEPVPADDARDKEGAHGIR